MTVSALTDWFRSWLPGATSPTTVARRRWIVTLVAVQALLLLGAWAVTVRQLQGRIAERVQEQVFRANVATIEGLAGVLSEMAEGLATRGSADWERAQSLVEGLDLPAGGFACLIDGDGRLLCHPELRRMPSMANQDLGGVVFRSGETSIPLRDLKPDQVVHGRIAFAGGLDRHLLSVSTIAGSDLRMLVHQPESGLQGFGESMTSGLGWFSLLMCAGVLLMTGWTAAWMTKRHDARIAAINEGLESEVATRVEQAMRFRDGMITGLAKLADHRDTDTGQHLDRIAAYSELLARGLAGRRPEVDEHFIRVLRTASAMHDIGKVGIGDEILLKPGRLTDAERTSMERHPLIGADTLMAIRRELGDDELVDMSIVVALQHHERWDGTGYPFRLAGDRIDLAARIVAVADVYDALTSRRVYKDAMPHERAVALIRDGAGTQFDPDIVAVFVELERQFDEIRTESWGTAGADPAAAGDDRRAAA